MSSIFQNYQRKIDYRRRLYPIHRHWQTCRTNKTETSSTMRYDVKAIETVTPTNREATRQKEMVAVHRSILSENFIKTTFQSTSKTFVLTPPFN